MDREPQALAPAADLPYVLGEGHELGAEQPGALFPVAPVFIGALVDVHRPLEAQPVVQRADDPPSHALETKQRGVAAHDGGAANTK
jgi:hypothetical protein